jgi:CTP:molybdopterin cytidylyltransferase MocA
MSSLRIGAVILAAGAGTRLGGVAKALLSRRDGTTFLASIFASARAAGLADAVVVLGPPHAEAIAVHAHELGGRIAVNPSPARGMASSVEVGFAAISESTCDAAWLWPVDHPDVLPTTLRTLIAALGSHTAVRPVVGGRGGHPPLIARTIWPQLAACGDVDGGARAVLAETDMLDLEVDDPGCIRDVDTPADLEAR